MPLDNEKTPARMVAAARIPGLPDELGDRLAAEMSSKGATPEAVKKMARKLKTVMTSLKGQIDWEEVIENTATSVGDNNSATAWEARLEAVALDAFANEPGRANHIEIRRPSMADMGHATFAGARPDAIMKHFGISDAQYMQASPADRRHLEMVDGLLARMDTAHEPTIGRDIAGMSLAKMHAETQPDPFRRGSMRSWIDRPSMGASHSRSDFPLIAGDAIDLYVARRFERMRPAIFEAAHLIERGDYRQGYSVGLSSSPALDVVQEGGEVRYISMDETGELLPVPEDVAGIFSMTNKLIQNDAVSLIAQAGNRMVEGAIDRARRMLIAPIVNNQTMRDGDPVFHTSRNNLAASGAAPSVTALGEARKAMRLQKDSNDVLLAIEPWAIICGADLETTCQQLLASIDATKTDDVNPFAGQLQLVVEPALPEGAWYLIGNPSRYDGLAYATLEGRSGPRVEMKEGWERLGAEYRCTWAFDAKFIQPLSWYKNPGV